MVKYGAAFKIPFCVSHFERLLSNLISIEHLITNLEPANTTLSALVNSGCLSRSSITAVRIRDP